MRNTIINIRSGEVYITSPNEQEKEFLRRVENGEFSREYTGVDLRWKVSGKVFSYIDGNKILHWVDAEGMSRLKEGIKLNNGVYTRRVKQSVEQLLRTTTANSSFKNFF